MTYIFEIHDKIIELQDHLTADQKVMVTNALERHTHGHIDNSDFLAGVMQALLKHTVKSIDNVMFEVGKDNEISHEAIKDILSKNNENFSKTLLLLCYSMTKPDWSERLKLIKSNEIPGLKYLGSIDESKNKILN